MAKNRLRHASHSQNSLLGVAARDVKVISTFWCTFIYNPNKELKLIISTGVPDLLEVL